MSHFEEFLYALIIIKMTTGMPKTGTIYLINLNVFVENNKTIIIWVAIKLIYNPFSPKSLLSSHPIAKTIIIKDKR